MTAEHDLHAGLRRVAEQLDRAVAPIDAAAVAGRRPPVAPRPARALLAAAAVLALLVGVVALLASEDQDEGVQADVPPASVTTDRPGTTTVPTDPTTPTTASTVPSPVVPPSYEGPAWDALPPSGLAFVEGERVTLADASGQELGSFATADVPGLGTEGADGLDIGPGLAVTRRPIPAEVPDACDTGTGGGVRVRVCGPDQRDLVRVEPSGEETLLSGLPLGAPLGRWRRAEPSPDGRWILATWSAECEVPFAVLVPAAGGTIRTADGFESFDVPEGGPFPATSWSAGWTPDGRAVVGYPESACGSSDPAPGIHLVDPDTGERTLLRAGGSIGVVPWERVVGAPNEREQALSRAAAELGLDACCGEPAHGGGGVTGGVVWEGVDVFVGGGDPGPITVDPGEGVLGDVAPGEVDGLPVTTWTLDGRAALALTCDDTRWVLGGAPVLEGEPPSPEALRALASALVPRLYCTVGEPPTVQQG